MGRLGGVAKRFEHVWLQVVRQLIMRRNLQCRDGAQSSLLAVTARCDTEDSRSPLTAQEVSALLSVYEELGIPAVNTA